MIKKLFMVLLTLATTINTYGQVDHLAVPISEDATISLLTSGPSKMAIFTAWGHTAIRVKDPQTGLDIIYNYGIFSFGKPLSFVSRFVSGQTDYRLGRASMRHSIEETIEKNANYYEQELNLTQQEKEKLYWALIENYKPENRVYRYKYFSDNCATRPRALIRNCVNGKLVYAKGEEKGEVYAKLFKKADGENKTYRDLIYEILPTSPWYRFGIDLCLGQPTDQQLTEWDQLFLPMFLKEEIGLLSIQEGDSLRPLVKATNKLLEKQKREKETEWTNVFNTSVVLWTVFLFALLHALYYIATGKDDRWAYLLFFTLTGLLGTVIFYVSCLSVHEFVSPNLNLLWMNPLLLVIGLLVYVKRAQKIERALMWVCGVGCVLSIIYFIICKAIVPTGSGIQQYNTANLPAILIELTLIVSWLLRYKSKSEKIETRKSD
ncbi:MAG: DUF4105 domain-containing protein [Paludibacteraceae bacterium]|nr:DUF4105 domain-containing protein [Paludibacteraceae bacterium]